MCKLHRARVLAGVALLVLCGAMAAPCGFAQRTFLIETQTTRIAVSAGGAAPRVLTLSTPGGEAWHGNGDDELIGSVVTNGRTVATHWVLNKQKTQADHSHILLVYETLSPRLTLNWLWQARSRSGPVEHSVSIRNLDRSDVTLPLQPSLNLHFAVDAGTLLRRIYVDKGAGKPTEVGTHDELLRAGTEWKGESSTYALDGAAREIIPISFIERQASQDGWFAGVEFSGRTLLEQRRTENSLTLRAGLNGTPGPYATIIHPGGTFEAPQVFVGAYAGGLDGAGNQLRPWVREVLGNPATWKDTKYPLLVNNSWGSGMQVDEKLAHRMIRDSAELGLEMFHVDAGWFRAVGDWYPDPNKFSAGLSALADEAHRAGLRFGIWVNWAEAGISRTPGSASIDDTTVRSWLVADTPKGWKPDEFIGRTMDLGAPAAREYAARETERMVSSYKLDMIEHDGYVVAKSCNRSDHPHVASPATESEVKGSGILLPLAANSTDVSYHAVRSYYEVQSRLRRDHPGLLFEICNDGGRMVDFGSAAHGDYFSITDSYDPVSNREAFFDASHVLPAAMLEDYVQKWPTPNIDNFRSMLRSGMMGWLTIMQDTNAWSEEQHLAAKRAFALYKSRLRPLIRDADLYHVSARPDGMHWDGVEYFNPQTKAGVLYAFRGADPHEDAHTFPLKGLAPGYRYKLHFEDRSSPDTVVLGRTLESEGVSVRLARPESSELIFLEQVID